MNLHTKVQQTGKEWLFSSDFDFFLHVDFLPVLVVELVLKEGKFLAWNDFDAQTISELPLSA